MSYPKEDKRSGDDNEDNHENDNVDGDHEDDYSDIDVDADQGGRTWQPFVGGKHTCKKRFILRRRLFWPKKFAEKVSKARQNVNRDKSA